MMNLHTLGETKELIYTIGNILQRETQFNDVALSRAENNSNMKLYLHLLNTPILARTELNDFSINRRAQNVSFRHWSHT